MTSHLTREALQRAKSVLARVAPQPLFDFMHPNEAKLWGVSEGDISPRSGYPVRIIRPIPT